MRKRMPVVLLLTAVLALTACGPSKPVKDDENTLIIEVVEAGYGTSFLEKLADAFEQSHEGIDVVVKPVNKLGELAQARVNSGPVGNPTDLFFSTSTAHPWRADIDKGNRVVPGYDTVLADLSEVSGFQPDGGERTVAELIGEEAMRYVRYSDRAGDEKCYVLPWAREATGLIYNDAMFRDHDWSVPKTTTQLSDLVKKIDNVAPFIWTGDAPYWQYLYMVWWAQYEGLENYRRFYSPKVQDPLTGITTYTRDEFNQKGREYALNLTYEYVNPANSYTNCSTLSFSTAQGYFLNGRAAMMPNGGWLENEVRQSFPQGADDFRMMKTPVASGIVERLETVKTDSKLIEVIDFVDGGRTGARPSGVSDADVDEVEIARNMMNDPGLEHIVFIPEYSNAKTLAIEFLKEFFAKSSRSVFLEESRAMPSAGIEDLSELPAFTPFEQSRFDCMKNAIAVNPDQADPLFYKGGANVFYGYLILEKTLGATNAADRKSGTEIFNDVAGAILRDWSTITGRALS